VSVADLTGLAGDVAAAVVRSGKTLEQLHEDGGPSPATLSRLMHFDPDRDKPWEVRNGTLAALDTVFGWSGEESAAKRYRPAAQEPGLRVADVDAFARLVAARVLDELAAVCFVRQVS
jgi:hypothetical protein